MPEFSFTEPMSPRFIYIDPEANRVFVLMPFVSGTRIGLDNTCKSVFALQEFFGKSRAVNQRAVLAELIAYKKSLEFDISLLDDASQTVQSRAIKEAKQARLAQINQYIAAIEIVLPSDALKPLTLAFPEYPVVLKNIMESKEANVHSMVLRPKDMDRYLRFVSPVFSLLRGENGAANESPFYKTLSDAYEGVIRLPNARSRLIASVVASPAGQSNDFSLLQTTLAEKTRSQLGVNVDFRITGTHQPITKELLDTALMATPGWAGEKL